MLFVVSKEDTHSEVPRSSISAKQFHRNTKLLLYNQTYRASHDGSKDKSTSQYKGVNTCCNS